MSKLTEQFISKAKNKGVDVKLENNFALRYKKTKFKTWSGKFTYETRKELISSLFCLVKNGYPVSP